jgi:membrane protein
VVNGANDLPLGLDEVRGLIYAVTLAAGIVTLFALLCLVYWRVPRGPIPWRYVWPGALGATVAIVIVDYAFPLYLGHVRSLRIGTSFLFVIMVLVWFYALALVVLAGAVVNELRFERDRDG